MRKTMLLIAVLVVAGAILAYWRITSPNSKVTSGGSYADISPAEYDAILANRDPFVVDVHIPEEEHLSETDTFIPYNEIANRLNELPKAKDAEIILYCRSGSMSQEAAGVLVKAGYTNVKNLQGGIQAYRESHQAVLLTPPLKNLGTVIYGDITKTDFTLKNNTASTLNVTSLSTSCSCTKAEMEKTRLGPYESATVGVSFDPAIHKDDSDLGELERTIYINTDNPNFPKLTASITATVVKR